MWSLRSLVLETDLFLTAFDGIVEDRGRYVVIRTPTSPKYWWGNFLLYPEPPSAEAATRGHDGSWLDDFARELPTSRATLLAWDRPDGAEGDVSGFLSRGFEVDVGAGLRVTRATLVRPPRWNAEVKVAPIGRGAEWDACSRVLRSAFEARRTGSPDDHRAFIEKQLARYRAMQDAKIGQWYGAFVGGELAGTLGLVRVGGHASLGRFQLVGTDPRFGRSGVCSTLVYAVCERALEEQGFETLVMAADAHWHAARVYESVGFEQAETLKAVLKKPPRV